MRWLQSTSSLTGLMVLALCALQACFPALDSFERPPYRGDRQLRQDAAAARHQDFIARRAAPGSSTFSPAVWLAAEAKMAAMPRHLPSGADVIAAGAADSAQAKAAHAWQFLGPSNVAGRMRTLVFHSRNPDVLFAGGVSGGVWRSDDRGETWIALSDDAVNLNVGALLIDTARPDVMYAGTGELYRNSGMPWSPMAGAGILKSSDGGRSWHQLDATANVDFRYVSDLVASPTIRSVCTLRRIRACGAATTVVRRSSEYSGQSMRRTSRFRAMWCAKRGARWI